MLRAVAQALPRLRAVSQRQEDEQKLERILAELDVEQSGPPVTRGGEASRRGIPIVGRGTAGVSPGTSPERALLAKGRRGRK
jgi:hypothetical protein